MSPILSGKPRRILLVDCNNFFVSCERVFNPALIGKPVVVLSNNDGCVIARSNEAKALAIPMGAPAFEYEALFKKHDVKVFSSNFALYGDMSSRVMQTLADVATDLEVYSIDEAFLHIVDLGYEQDPLYFAARAQLLVRTVKQHTGIPISIGIGPTKTLAKIANKIAKKNPEYGGVYDITDYAGIDTLLQTIPVEDVWGVGRRYTAMLYAHGIRTAQELKYAADVWVRKKMTVVGLKTVHELRGTPCFLLAQEIQPNKSFVVSRSFGKPVTTLTHLKQAAALHATTAGAKLRKQKLVARHISVFVLVRAYDDPHRYYRSAGVVVPQATSYTPALITAVKACIDILYKPGRIYKKVGVMLNDINSADNVQLALNMESITLERQAKAMGALDHIGAKWGNQMVTFAATGVDHPWKPKVEKRSACFTTSWEELLTVDTSEE